MSNLNDRQDFLNRITDLINTNITNDQFGVSELAREMGMSRSNLHRKVISYTGSSVSRFICKVRLERAKVLLEESVSTISEIAFETGFHSVTYFTKCFKEHFGYPPGEERKKVSGAAREKETHDHKIKSVLGKTRMSIWYLYTAIIILILLVVLIVVFKPSPEKAESLDKSIAVLPFINDSPEEENTYFINGTMESILNHLCKIADLRVVSRSSVEQYRDTVVFIPDVARRMKVSYVLAGSMQKYGNQIRMTLRLIDREDNHVWSEQYDREITNIEEHLSLQSEIAQIVAEELQAVITPEEKQLMEDIPTENKTAWDFYLRGTELSNYWADRVSLFRARDLFRYSLEIDPEFSYPYVGIAQVYSFLYERNPFDNALYLDSIIAYAEKTLSLDNQMYYAYAVKGNYYRYKGEMHTALEMYDKAVELNPSLFDAYNHKAWLYLRLGDYPKSIENFYKMSQLERGPSLPDILRNLGFVYWTAGFTEKQIELADEAFSLDQDTLEYYSQLMLSYSSTGNIDKTIEYGRKVLALDSINRHSLLSLGESYLYRRQLDTAQLYFDRYLEVMEAEGVLVPNFLHLVAYTYQQNGDLNRAKTYIEKRFEYYEDSDDHANLAATYMLMGDIQMVYYHFSELVKSEVFAIWHLNSLNLPMWDKIRSEPEFLQVVDAIEENYYKQHERVRQQLEANNML